MYPKLKKQTGDLIDLTDILDYYLTYTQGTWPTLNFSLPYNSPNVLLIKPEMEVQSYGISFIVGQIPPPENLSGGSVPLINYECPADTSILEELYNQMLNTGSQTAQTLMELILYRQEHTPIVDKTPLSGKIPVHHITGFTVGMSVKLAGSLFTIAALEDVWSTPPESWTGTYTPTIIGHTMTLNTLPSSDALAVGNLIVSQDTANATGYTVGTISPIFVTSGGNPVKRSLESEFQSVSENLNSLADKFNGILHYDCDLKTVSLLDPDPLVVNPTVIEYGVNLLDPSTSIEEASFTTRLYCYGKNDITMSSVNLINPGKPYIEDFSYVTELGTIPDSRKIREGVYRNSDAAYPEDLYNAAVKEMQRVCRPQISYKIPVVDLDRVSDLELGSTWKLLDMVNVESEEHKLHITEMVTKLQFYPLYPEKTVLDLKNKPLTIQDALKAVIPPVVNPDPIIEENVTIPVDTIPPGPVRDAIANIINNPDLYTTWGYAYKITWINPIDEDFYYTLCIDSDTGEQLYQSYDSVDSFIVEWNLTGPKNIRFRTFDISGNCNESAGSMIITKETTIGYDPSIDSPGSGSLFSMVDGVLTFNAENLAEGQNLTGLNTKQLTAVANYTVKSFKGLPKIFVSDGTPDNSMGKDGDLCVVVGGQSPMSISSAYSDNTGKKIYLEFNRMMKAPGASPAGFTVKLNGTAATMTGITLYSEDTLELVISDTVDMDDVITLDYAPGTISSVGDELLAAVTGMSVTNGIASPSPVLESATISGGNLITMTFDKEMKDPAGNAGRFTVSLGESLHQTWSGYPATPDLSTTYPYQFVATEGGVTYLCVATKSFFISTYAVQNDVSTKVYTLDSDAWSLKGTTLAGNNLVLESSLKKANFSIYNSNLRKSVYFNANAASSNSVLGSSIALGTDKKQINLTLASTVDISNGLKLSYNPGTVADSLNNLLGAFTDFTISEYVAPSPYQQWGEFPDSPLLTSEYPYQAILFNSQLILSQHKMYRSSDFLVAENNDVMKRYLFSSGNWAYNTSATSFNGFAPLGSLNQANSDIYTDATLTVVEFAKTTD